tara:strand:- start:2066 stop:2479 length:414 start_codon:yes stop_codon:yes gene_type:complete
MNRAFKIQDESIDDSETNEALLRRRHFGYLPNGVGRWRQEINPIRPALQPFNQHTLIRIPRHHQTQLITEAVNRMIRRGDIAENFPVFHNSQYSLPNLNRRYNRTTGISVEPEDTGGTQQPQIHNNDDDDNTGIDMD